MKMEMTITGKKGSLTKFEIAGEYEAALEIVEEVTTYTTFRTEDGLEGSGSRSDIAKIAELVNKYNNKQAKVEVKAPKKAVDSRRYVDTLANADSLKLKHGKSWVCTEYDIECNGVRPEFDGELICYVYSN